MIEKHGKGQKPVEGGKWSMTPQPVMNKPGFTMVEAAQAVEKNSTGGKNLTQSGWKKDKPGA